MKRNLLIVFFASLFSALNLNAQESALQQSSIAGQNNVSIARKLPGTSSINALFDLKFDYVLPRGGFAGITWLYSDFWVSKWQSDSVFVVDDSTGALSSFFFISGVTGIRGMAFDGTGVWVANNTVNIYKVDTATKAIIDTVVAPFDVRGIAWDSSANGGAGGLWVANYSTDILQISLTGSVLGSILATSHGLTSMYSIAYDPFSTGGPYIWAFDQGAAGTGQNLVRINISSGTKDVVHDVGLEIGGTGISGGLAITGFAHPGPHTLIGVSQDSPDRVFGLELGDYTPPMFDAAADSVYFYPPNTSTPGFLAMPINWEVRSTNSGTHPLDTVRATVTVNDGSSNVFTDSHYTANVLSLNSTTVSLQNTFMPMTTTGLQYDVTAVVSTGSQTDQVNTNDSLKYSFFITDTTLTRNGAMDGSIGIGNGTGGSMGVLFEIPVLSYATSATFSLRRPTAGDSVRAELFGWGGSTPSTLIAQSATYIIKPADTNGVLLTLPFIGAPILLNQGTYLAAIHEHNFNVSIAYSFFNWRPSSSWINIPANGWLPSESYNFKVVPFIGLNVWSQSMVGIAELKDDVFTVYPNPVSDNLILNLPEEGEYSFTVTDIRGRIIYSSKLYGRNKELIRTSDWENGLYIATLETKGNSYNAKVIVRH